MAHVLIVEDDKGLRAAVRALLHAEGHSVDVAENADQALTLLSKGAWDVVVADIVLPGRSGLDLLKAIRSAAPGVQVIMMTGDPSVESAAEAVRAGARDYLPKPATKNAILRSVATAAQMKRLEDERARLTEENRGYQLNLERLVEARTKELYASREQLRALAARLQAVREEERTRVAREIHDVLAQDLTLLKIDLVWLQGRLTNPAKAAAADLLNARVSEMITMANESIRAVQAIATDLRPAVLDSLGLCAAVEWKAQDFQSRSGIECEADVPEDELPMNRESATAVFRIVQEGLTNVLRHANASRVVILLRKDEELVLLRVSDNGRGIGSEQLKNPKSIGLAGMRERALLLGGQFEIRSEPGAGTMIEVRIPVMANASLLEGKP